ncbi:AbfB domain-containing protein [Streptosporangium amethystogenes]|uniref:AbfB domain-containing protein n=1 Tax=Streptosporangium amethystogenes TaxID=2002 RepID=UPI001FE130AE|nr:AbfB domain-containing protein [Streptosporangium amethystogenes]
MWDFAVTGRDAGQPSAWSEQIRVPYPAESALSGIMRKITGNDRLWYRRTFTVPAGWSGKRVQLNFGAVDWQTTVWVNGVQAGSAHTGGYDSFGYDITPLLNGGVNTVVVSVYDATGTSQVVGKQTLNPSAIFYTATSGIWQTVWLEPTPTAHVTRLDITPDVPAGQLHVIVRGAGTSGHTAQVTASAGGTAVGTASGAVGAEIRVPIPNARLWSPDDPFLYDLRVELRSGSTVVETVGGYSGMRSIALASVGGVLRPVLNGSYVFQMGTLDQGFWPDGIHTAPTDDALRFDLQAHKDMGFNTVRKHIKVEPQRWYYWADRLGLIVWQDMPSGGSDTLGRQYHEAEMRRMIDQLRSTTSIVMWIPFNEGWGEYEPAANADLVKSLDASRLVDNNSGSNCCGWDGGNGDVIDDHVYPGPGDTQQPSGTRAAVLGEYGGIRKQLQGHTWTPVGSSDTNDVTAQYLNLLGQVQTRMTRFGLSAAIYTQITDVENELNGIYTYDRQVAKVDLGRIKSAQQALIALSKGTRPLTSGTAVSLRVTTPGYTDRYLRHQLSLARTDVVGSGGDALLKQDSTFVVRPGLAEASCYSFESRNFPGHFLRHQEFRVRKDANDGTALFRADATFCAEGPPGALRLSSYNIPGTYLRHIGAEVYIASNGGSHTWDNPASYLADTTWAVSAPWAP